MDFSLSDEQQMLKDGVDRFMETGLVLTENAGQGIETGMIRRMIAVGMLEQRGQGFMPGKFGSEKMPRGHDQQRRAAAGLDQPGKVCVS